MNDRVHKYASLFLFLGCAAIAGCSGSSTTTGSGSTNSSPTPSLRTYNGTASVGDFLTISINPSASTITYDDITNGETGTVSYTTNSDGTYAITDPQGNLLSAYEVPGYMLVVEAAKAGPNQNTRALITAIENTPVSIANFAANSFNYMQFRTSSGGLEIGTASIDTQGDISNDGYWPMAAIAGGPMISGGTFPASSISENASGDFFTITEQGGAIDTVFGTQNGLWAVDSPNGAILGLPKASSPVFDPSTAGTYTAIYYKKSNAQTGMNNVETGTATEGKGIVTITSSGGLTIADSNNNVLATGTLAAVANTPYLYDGTANTLPDPCYGMFTVRIANSSSQQDVFVTFQGNAVLFSSFQTALPATSNNQYTYFYGVGLQ